MQTSEKIDLISAALVAASKVRLVGKSGNNTYDKYKYAKLEDYVIATDEVLRGNGLTIVSSAEAAESLPNRPTKSGGTEYPVRVTLKVRAVHTSGQWIETTTIGEGQDRGDKGIYKAITGARKYGIAMILGLVTSDDPETHESEEPPSNRNAPPPQRQAPAKPAEASRKDQLFAMIDKWSGITGSDRTDAIRYTIAAYGFKASKDKPLTDAQIEDVGRLISVDMEAGKKWADVVHL